ncbi:hypothetical protein DRQ09_04125 [candidate division KSB1 bacterium]|nr:MAG: hypothetical protein DRQ09_04125 [candidate division KSB1 bacterium]
MIVRIVSFVLSFFLLIVQNLVFSQTASLNGQLSGWLTGNREKSLVSQAGLRYIPEVSIKKIINKKLPVDAEISFNIFTAGNFHNWNNPDIEGRLKVYRLWARFSGNKFEARLGLQEINFGSAILFRPLMWFDRVDPRDPLHLTDGVYGLLLRYFFQNNVNIWLWGLYDNNLKGWETIPTEDNGLELGGRLQIPISSGEAGICYHHRRTDFSHSPGLAELSSTELVEENRFAFDCKLDIKIGLWFEGTIIQRNTNIPFMKYQQMWTAGMDYTFNIGNGLNILTEFFNLKKSAKIFDEGEGFQFTGLMVNYPVGLIDRVSGIYYFDWKKHNNYLWINWQRTYDNWILYLIGFSNPKTIQLNRTQTGNNVFSGNGFQIMIAFNH